MRITPNITMQNSLYNIQSTRARMDSIQEKIASSKNYNRPSDDPVSVSLLVNMNDRMTVADQYTSNISKSDTWLKMSNTALTGMNSFIEMAKKAVSSVAGGETDPNVINNALLSLKSIKQNIVDMGNTQMNGVYLFSGTKSLTKPFLINSGDTTSGSPTISNLDSVTGLSAGMAISGVGIPAGTTIAAVNAGPPASLTLSANATATATGAALNTYAGDNGVTSIEINQGVTQAINFPGNNLLTPTPPGGPYGSVDVLATMDQLIADVASSNATGIQAGKQLLYQAGVQLNAAQSDLQARTVRLDAANTMNKTIISTLQTVYGNIQNVDYAQLGIEMSQQETALNATYSSTAKISQMSLLDYL